MPSARNLLSLLWIVAALTGCPAKKEASPGGASVACSSPDQDRCWELLQPTAEQRAAIAVECSSGSSKLSSPAACPTARFIGKCTIGSEVRRWYRAEDAAYQQDFCVSSAKGVWSTVF